MPRGSTPSAPARTATRAGARSRQALSLLPAEERRAFWSTHIRTDAALAALRRHPLFVRLDTELSRGQVIHACSSASPRGLRRQPRRRASFRLPDGDWLEQRTLLAASPLEPAVPLHFGTFNDATVSHFLSIPDEFDLYSVTLQRGETLDVSIDAQQAGSGLASLLRVFDASGTPLAARQPAGGRPATDLPGGDRRHLLHRRQQRPDNNYNPLVAGSGTPGGTTGLYTLDVSLTTRRRLMPDLTGSSFRTGLDMAAAGDTIPVSFTVAEPRRRRPRQLPGPGAAGRQQSLRQLVAGAGDVHEGASWWPTRRAGASRRRPASA